MKTLKSQALRRQQQQLNKQIEKLKTQHLEKMKLSERTNDLLKTTSVKQQSLKKQKCYS